LTLAAVACAALAGAAAAGDWRQFRGPNGAGISDDDAPAEWSAKKNVTWKVAVPGYGWSSPVVSADRVFLTTAVAAGQKAPQRKGPGGGEKLPPDETYSWEVHCVDAATGKTLWKRVAASKRPTIANHVSNTFASETPVTDGERVYAYFGMAGVVQCYDVSGKPLWNKDLGPYRIFGNWGNSASPALDGGRLFVQCDNAERSFVVALDAKTGKESWRTPRPEKSTWSTPVVWRNKVRTELVLMGTRKVRSYDPADGKVLWELTTDEGSGRGAPKGGKGGAGGCKSTPVATDEMIYLGMASRAKQELGPLWAVKAGASGDVSLKGDEKSNKHVAWYRSDAGPHFASAVVHRGLLYVFAPHDGTIRCFDAKTGEAVYQKKLPGARDFKASPWVAGGKVFNVDENGTTFIMKAGRDFELLAKNSLDELCWSSPAPACGALFIRTVGHLYRIDRPKN
jgi:outer membrane protein assembly factor BamB